MDTTAITRSELADLLEQHIGQLVAALRRDGGTTHPLEEETADAMASIEAPANVVAAIREPIRGERWNKVGELEGESYSWPTGTEDYSVFEVWETVDGDGRRWQLGLGQSTARGIYYGRERGYWLVFEMVNGQKRRPIVVFTEGDNPDELVAVIKGKGPGGRSMFAPGDELPRGYERLVVDVFRDRITGPQAFNRLAVVAVDADREAMLDHGLLQLHLRT